MENIKLKERSMVEKIDLDEKVRNYEEEVKRRAEAYRKHVLKMDTYGHQIGHHLCAEWCQYLAGGFGD